MRCLLKINLELFFLSLSRIRTHTLTLIVCVGVKARQPLCCDVTGIHLPLMTCGFMCARSLIMANLGSRLAWDRGHKTLQQPAKMKIMYKKSNTLTHTHTQRDRGLINYFHAPKSCIHFGIFRGCQLKSIPD